MTIGDFIAGLLEKRRKKFEERYKYQNSFWENGENYRDPSEYNGNLDDQLNDVLRMFGLDASSQDFPDSFHPPPVSYDDKVDNDLDGKITRSNIRSFFKKRNDGDPNLRRSYVANSGVSQSSRIIRNPDGTVQVETIIKDNNGNIERRVSYAVGDKVYTVITKTDPSGNQKVEKNISADGGAMIPNIKSYWNSTGEFTPGFNNSDSEYDYWFNKFFRKDADSMPTNPFGFGNQFEEQIEKIVKTFKPEIPADSFNNGKTWKPATNTPAYNKDDGDMQSVLDDFMKQNGIIDENNIIFDEMKKFLESVENQKKGVSGQKNIKNHKDFSRNSGRRSGKAPLNVFPKKPTLFDAIDERSKLEIDENPPFDKFIEPDEERLEKMKPFLEQTRRALEGLHKFFREAENANSDIKPGKNIENISRQVDLLLPEVPVERSEPLFNIVKNPFTQHSLNNGYVTSQTYFSDGKSRKETIRRSDDGTTEKIVTYVIGDKSYVVNIKSDRYGQEHRVKKHINMNQDDVKQFSRVWGEKYKSDFED